MVSLVEINRKYEDIIYSNHSDEHKVQGLPTLLNVIKDLYEMPDEPNAEWESEHPTISSMYRIIYRTLDTYEKKDRDNEDSLH